MNKGGKNDDILMSIIFYFSMKKFKKKINERIGSLIKKDIFQIKFIIQRNGKCNKKCGTIFTFSLSFFFIFRFQINEKKVRKQKTIQHFENV